LTSTLLEHGLADDVMLFVYPVLLGKEKRFFSDETAPRRLVLTGAKAVSSGILINTYTVCHRLRERNSSRSNHALPVPHRPLVAQVP
jgi:dihydrofolate reductase